MRPLLAALALGLTLGCGDKDDADSGGSADGADGTTAATGDCSDADYNPYAGTCVESFLADCFDPSGACDGVATATGDVTLEWASGATVETTVDYSDPLNPGANTTITSSTGEICATGVTQSNASGCASLTVYTRPDGATQQYCSQSDGSTTVTCDDGTTVAVSSSQSSGAEQCQYGDAEACTVDIQY